MCMLRNCLPSPPNSQFRNVKFPAQNNRWEAETHVYSEVANLSGKCQSFGAGNRTLAVLLSRRCCPKACCCPVAAPSLLSARSTWYQIYIQVATAIADVWHAVDYNIYIRWRTCFKVLEIMCNICKVSAEAASGTPKQIQSCSMHASIGAQCAHVHSLHSLAHLLLQFCGRIPKVHSMPRAKTSAKPRWTFMVTSVSGRSSPSTFQQDCGPTGVRCTAAQSVTSTKGNLPGRTPVQATCW